MVNMESLEEGRRKLIASKPVTTFACGVVPTVH